MSCVKILLPPGTYPVKRDRGWILGDRSIVRPKTWGTETPPFSYSREDSQTTGGSLSYTGDHGTVTWDHDGSAYYLHGQGVELPVISPKYQIKGCGLYCVNGSPQVHILAVGFGALHYLRRIGSGWTSRTTTMPFRTETLPYRLFFASFHPTLQQCVFPIRGTHEPRATGYLVATPTGQTAMTSVDWPEWDRDPIYPNACGADQVPPIHYRHEIDNGSGILAARYDRSGDLMLGRYTPRGHVDVSGYESASASMTLTLTSDAGDYLEWDSDETYSYTFVSTPPSGGYYVGTQSGDLSVVSLYEWDPTRTGGVVARIVRLQYEGTRDQGIQSGANAATSTLSVIGCGQEDVQTYSSDMTGTYALLCFHQMDLQLRDPVPFPGNYAENRNFFPRMAVSDLGQRMFFARRPIIRTVDNLRHGFDEAPQSHSATNRVFFSDEMTSESFADLMGLDSLDGLDPYTLRVRT